MSHCLSSPHQVAEVRLMLIALSETRALLFAHLAFVSFSAWIQVHMWCLVLFSFSAGPREICWDCSLFSLCLFLAYFLSFYSRIQNFHDFSAGDCIFPNRMSCQTVGFTTIFSLRDLLDVSVGLIHFHLDFVPRSLLV